MKTEQLRPWQMSSAFGPRLSTLAVAFILQFSSLNPLLAAPFDCGSTGAYGPMNITSNTTLQLPPDGIFHCTTITVATNTTLSFFHNALNTPVYLLATGDVVINGTVDVSGSGSYGRGVLAFNGSSPNKAGPGGFDGGYGGMYFNPLSTAGDGDGPGGGKHLMENRGLLLPGAFGTSGGGGGGAPYGYQNTNTYGNLLLIPLIGGSGGTGFDGTPGEAGGGGGGAILIAANTRIIINGVVIAMGGDILSYNQHAAGSGGGIKLVAPAVTGNGSLNASGGMNYTTSGGPGGHGRIRIDCTDFLAWRSLTMSGQASRGNRMVVFPAAIPQLDILEVAGNAIPEGTNAPARFEIPGEASTNQFVKVQARNFTNDVPIRVVITPENGPRGEFDATILQSSGNPPFAIVPVVIPAGSACQVHAWTR